MAYGIIDFISQQTNCSNHEFFDWCHFVKHTQIIHIMNYLTYQIRANYSNHELFGKTDRPIDGQTYGWRTDRWCHSFLKIDTFLPPKKDSWHLSSGRNTSDCLFQSPLSFLFCAKITKIISTKNPLALSWRNTFLVPPGGKFLFFGHSDSRI